MASRTLHQCQTPEVAPLLITGRFYPNGTSTAALTVYGKGVSGAVRTASAGVFTVTLTDAHYQVVGFGATVQHTTAVDLVAQFGAFSNLGTSTATTFTIRILAGATGTDMTANADSSVSFWILFNNTTAQS